VTTTGERIQCLPLSLGERGERGEGQPHLAVHDLGLIDYAAAMALQDDLAERRRLGEIPDTLLLLEHPPVITLGRRGSLDDVYLDEAGLRRRGIALHRTTRGGLVTYHGPGQLVGYPILRPHALGRTIPDYVCGLQRTLIAALAELGIAAHTDPDHVGVWTDAGKIAAIGVAQRHGVTLHGFAVNLQPDLAHFALINPCGIGGLGVTSAAALLGHDVDPAAFKGRLVRAFRREFGYAEPPTDGPAPSAERRAWPNPERRA
jgi:lipoate-protein ligase B